MARFRKVVRSLNNTSQNVFEKAAESFSKEAVEATVLLTDTKIQLDGIHALNCMRAFIKTQSDLRRQSKKDILDKLDRAPTLSLRQAMFGLVVNHLAARTKIFVPGSMDKLQHDNPLEKPIRNIGELEKSPAD